MDVGCLINNVCYGGCSVGAQHNSTTSAQQQQLLPFSREFIQILEAPSCNVGMDHLLFLYRRYWRMVVYSQIYEGKTGTKLIMYLFIYFC